VTSNPTLSQPAPAAAIPARMLAGLTLANGWEVTNGALTTASATGSNFSVGYEVRKATGQRGFLKALDYVSRLHDATDPARDLEYMTTAFNFERDILAACRHMSRVVTAIEEGSVTVPGVAFGKVQYLIFELADGDVRRHMDLAEEIDVAWTLRTLHHVAGGLFQMHREKFAHQDLKPSNVLTFESGKSAKIADLGRAASRVKAGPFDDEVVAGDPMYAPPELLYGEPPQDWNARRIGCDVYHLGSMIAFFFSGTQMTSAILNYLSPDHRPANTGGGWTGTYAEALPYVRSAFEQATNALAESIEAVADSSLREDLVPLLRELCDPDPEVRGDPKRRVRRAGPLALERYVTRLDVLATRWEVALRRSIQG
jgi:eukaryotic-like serine/threonine-protein kinase